jgi:predicted RNA-binding Zn ribbon-like protein
VKQCAGEGCGWLFLDTSRNHLRRWCTMDECGNRAKMRRRYERVRNRTSL